ncbi:MAG: hypothetical protein JXA66_08785 [Oligoflexia bacterium]|nr:hypothetical protein [Oligoflexia bacterium]
MPLRCLCLVLLVFASLCRFVFPAYNTGGKRAAVPRARAIPRWEEMYAREKEKQQAWSRTAGRESREKESGDEEDQEQAASESSSDESGIRKAVSVTAGFENIKTQNIATENITSYGDGLYFRLVPGLLFDSEPFYGKLAVPLRFNARGLKKDDYDEPADYLHILEKIRVSSRTNTVLVTGGDAESYTLNNGMLVKGYNNNINIDSFRWGFNSSLRTGRGGGEIFFNDVLDTDFYAVSLNVVPLLDLVKLRFDYMREKNFRLDMYSAALSFIYFRNWELFYEMARTGTSFGGYGHGIGAIYSKAVRRGIFLKFSGMLVSSEKGYVYGYINDVYNLHSAGRYRELQEAGSDYGANSNIELSTGAVTCGGGFTWFRNSPDYFYLKGIARFPYDIELYAEYFYPQVLSPYWIVQGSKGFMDLFRIKAIISDRWNVEQSKSLSTAVLMEFFWNF